MRNVNGGMISSPDGAMFWDLRCYYHLNMYFKHIFNPLDHKYTSATGITEHLCN